MTTTKTQRQQTENRRLNGKAVWTPISLLPERFTYGPHTKAMSEYLGRRWSAHSYGWYRRTPKDITFNPEWTPNAEPGVRFRPDDRRFRWVEHPSAGLRFVGKAHEIRSDGDGNRPYIARALVDHNGWYTDSLQDELAWGEVYQLPARNGESVYVPAIRTSNDDRDGNDGAVLDFHATTSDLKDAIRWADSMAERFAEDEREYQVRESAKMRIEENTDAIKQAYTDFKNLCREIRANCDAVKGLEHVRKLIHAEYRRVKRTVAKMRKENAKLTDNFWAIDPNY